MHRRIDGHPLHGVQKCRDDNNLYISLPYIRISISVCVFVLLIIIVKITITKVFLTSIIVIENQQVIVT